MEDERVPAARQIAPRQQLLPQCAGVSARVPISLSAFESEVMPVISRLFDALSERRHDHSASSQCAELFAKAARFPRLSRLGNALLDLLYPRRARCMGCGSQTGCLNDWLCEDCRQALARSRMGARRDSALDGMAAVYSYHGPAGGMVRSLKFAGVKLLAEPMAADMAEAERAMEPTGIELVVPVPMHPRRRRRRGFNHSELLARGVAEKLSLPYADALVRTRHTVQQSVLEGAARRTNLRNAFECRVDLTGRRVLLVDDVYTTGTTARECARALRKAGARNVYLLAYSAGGR